MRYLALLAALAILHVAGCTDKNTAANPPGGPIKVTTRKPPTSDTIQADEEKSGSKSPRSPKPARPPVTPIKIVEADEPAPTAMPPVVMSDGHAKTCKLKVGDKLPDAELAELDGGRRKISQLLGEKATVVLFWSDKLLFAREAINDFPSLVVAPFEKQGLRIITINVGDEPAAVKKSVSGLASYFPILLDPRGEYFAQVASAKLPRIYVLDAAGKIVWFEIEYGRTARREVRQAVRFLLNGPAKPPL